MWANECLIAGIHLVADAIMPLVNLNLPVDIDPDAVVGLCIQTVDARREVKPAVPAYGEMIGRHVRSG